MQFSNSFLIAALPFLAASAPAPASYSPASNTPQNSGPVGLIATRSASPIHLQSVNASGQAFWIGKPTSSYCPLVPASSCPPGTDTVISITGDAKHPGGASLGTLNIPLGCFQACCIPIHLTTKPYRRRRSRRSTDLYRSQWRSILHASPLRL